MRRLPCLVTLTVLGLTDPAAHAIAGCQLERMAQIPVTMNGLQPLVHAKINGQEAQFILDSGAFYNLLTPAGAAQYNLQLRPAPMNFQIRGVGGASAQVSVTTVQTFTFFNLDIPKVDFFVAGNDVGYGVVGLIGQNLLRIADVEYDLGNGVIRLMRPKDCRKSVLAYWATGVPYSVIDIERATLTRPHTVGEAYLNGKRMHVLFDTGAGVSYLSLEAARWAGITPESPGVTPGGWYHGLGRRMVKTYIATFASFKLGDEEIRNARLRFGGDLLPGTDMLIGPDFFLSHHIYVASSQGKLYFTYNGGPVFNLTANHEAPPATDQPAAPESADASAATPPGTPAAPRPGDPGDAAGYAQRGAASAARREFPQAIEDFNRAIELAPKESSYFYARGMAHWELKQMDPAMSDMDQAIELNADNAQARVARAQLHMLKKDDAAAVSDLDAADHAMPKNAADRLNLGDLYLRAAQYQSAVAQFDDWVSAHPTSDILMVRALNLRCWTRALWGQELHQALLDCDAALKLNSAATPVYVSRAMVHLRQGEYTQAVADYDRQLAKHPDDAWARYGRGIAELRQGHPDQGHADLEAATAKRPDIAAAAARHGITP
jgi:tetratricopeptide (TPR) repeat protein